MSSSTTNSMGSESITLVGYLTPYKVAIANLIMMYCDGLIPTSSKIAVMSGVVNFLDSIQGQSNTGPLKIIDGNLVSLKNALSAVEVSTEGRGTLYDVLISKLWSFRSLDDIHTFFQSVMGYLVKPGESTNDPTNSDDELNDSNKGLEPSSSRRLKPSSILGSFLRRCYLSFDQLSFDQVAELWKAFEAFKSSSKEDWEKLIAGGRVDNEDEDTADDDHMHLLKGVQKLIKPQNDMVYISTENLDSLLEFQAQKLEKHSSVLPDNIRNLLENLIKTEQEVPSTAYFVQYLDSCKNLDYEKAFENLHRFYDYTMDNRGRTHYQYALFTLAVLQAQYQGHQEALKAAQEAISVARENMDVTCLTQILSWIHSYLVNNPMIEVPESLAIKEQIAQYLKAKSGETSIGLYALSYQTEVSEIMSRGDSLTAAFEALTKSFYIQCSNEMQVSSYSKLNLVQSALWNRCGNHTLSELYSTFCSDDGNSLILLQASIRRAEMLFSRGEIDQTFVLMENLEPLASTSPTYLHVWLPALLLLKTKRSMNEHKLHEARMLLEKLTGFDWDDSNLQQEMKIVGIKLESLSENYSKALRLAYEALDQSLKYELDIVFQLRYVILYARVLLSTFQPERAFTLVLRYLTVAQQASLQSLSLEAVVVLASILNAKSLNKESLAIIDSNIPAILEGGDVELIAEAYEVIADASLGMTKNKHAHSMTKSSSKSLFHAWNYIIQSGTFYETSRNLKKLQQVCTKQLEIARLLDSTDKIARTQDVMGKIKRSIIENTRTCLV